MNSMTVLEASEVHHLMSSNYPEIYSEYNKGIAEKVKQGLLQKQRELEAVRINYF